MNSLLRIQVSFTGQTNGTPAPSTPKQEHQQEIQQPSTPTSNRFGAQPSPDSPTRPVTPKHQQTQLKTPEKPIKANPPRTPPSQTAPDTSP